MKAQATTLHESAWAGTKWLFRNAREYGLHASAGALLHLDLCSWVHSDCAAIELSRSWIQEWFHRSRLKILQRADTAIQYMGLCSYLLAIHSLRSHCFLPDGEWYLEAIEESSKRFVHATERVITPDGAASYWLVAHGLRLNGVNVDVTRLEACAPKLPRIGDLKEPLGLRATASFDYCTHAILYKTHMLRRINPRLRGSSYFQWLECYFRMTNMREDIELLSEFLNCAGVVGWSDRVDGPNLLLSIMKEQGRTGCWHGILTSPSRYDRFHATWVASEALHLHSRILG